ncbi:HD-GYP domain-containing protein [Pelosinus propionicus]|uniref:HDIG domain-containing protein n=1 Tax=Pelosinus propionicus DSM 13327 TaxID=1123291 RepID=A0A1I4KAN0_9FIRM|nr:HD domain-containing phosphohydrolase [Pelosinus propionicus]SFL75892.1 HDIG domain-containing protein [Pelosinus propionicus DSM 13327]
MKKVASADLQPGMIVAEAIHSLSGKQILFPKGGTLTDKTIQNIKNWDIAYVRIESDTESEPDIIEEKGEEVSELPPVLIKKAMDFDHTLQDSIAQVEELLNEIRNNKKIDIIPYHKIASAIFEHLTYPTEAVNRLLFSLAPHNSLAYHSVMVAALSGMLAQWMNFSSKDIKEIIFAGLLHDVGKTQLPLELLMDKNPAAADSEKIQAHVLLTFRLLKDIKALSPTILTAIVQHHEYMDGSGYPRQLASENIHVFARVIGVVNHLSNIIAESESINPFTLLQEIKLKMFTKLDPTVCDVFSRRINDYLLSSSVLLEDGRKAKVAFLPNVTPTYPILQVEDEFIDMIKDKEVKIVGLIM